jgi:two-component system, OmpR family, Ni(II)-sensor and/or redox sensor kinase NrsS
MNSYSLFRRSRLRLALWYAGVMGVILSVSGLGMYRAMVQTNWAAMEREIESIAGTLHDSVEPLLPASEEPTAVLQRIFPDLCLSGKSCNATPTLIQRHTIGISDRTTYYIRLFNHQGKLLAFSPNQPLSLPQTLNRTSWQTFRTANGIRYHQFTTILHSANTHPLANEANADSSWGYLQIGRTLEHFDTEIRRIQWILGIGLPIALGLVATSSWWLSGLAMQPIYQSYQQQQQFTANAAHELRSPLAGLLATVEAILRIPQPQSNQEDIQMMLHTVERQGRRLSHLIADLLLLTSLEQNLLEQNLGAKPFQSCCLNDLVSDLTEEFLELATAADIHLTCQIPTSEVYTLGNESQLYRLVSNLIANAIQYTSRGGYVSVSLVKRDHSAVIAVKDTGIGIPLADQNRIFDRFYRVDGDAYGGLRLRSQKTGGTGLGLAIAVAIAQKHQANLRVESQVEKGSIFTLEVKVFCSLT